MESFEEAFEALVNMGPETLERFGASMPASWIEEALAATGSASMRRRKLPADQAVWLVLGMGLYEDRAIRDVVDHLSLVLPGVESLAPSAITQARHRLGPEPMEWLFRRVADTWSNVGGGGGYKGLALYAVDGTCLRVQDTDENFEHFGKPGSRNGSGDAGYPQLRLACLMNLETRLLVDACFGAYAKSEHELAASLWASVPNKSLTILDRGFVDYVNFAAFADDSRDRHLLVRMRENMKPQEIEALPDGTLKVRLLPSSTARASNPNIREEIIGRVIAYQHPDGAPGRLFTTLLDPAKFTANDLIELYHARWEVELGFDELKTHMRDRTECLRSKKPELVAQELWGLLLVYNLVRREMLLVARTHTLPPQRISFVSSLMWIRSFWLTSWRGNPTNVPKHLGNVHSQLRVFFLPERRSERRYPRHVKIKMSNYARNRGTRGSPKPDVLN